MGIDGIKKVFLTDIYTQDYDMIKKFSISLLLSLVIFSDAFALQALLEEDNVDQERVQSHCFQRHREFSKTDPIVSEIFWKLNVCFASSNGFRREVYQPLLDALIPHLQDGSVLRRMEEETAQTIASHNTSRISQSTNSSDVTLTAAEKEEGVDQLLEAFSVGLNMARDSKKEDQSEKKKSLILASPHEDKSDIAMVSCQGTGIGNAGDFLRADKELSRELSNRKRDIEEFLSQPIAPLFQYITSLGQQYNISCLDEPVRAYSSTIVLRAAELGLADFSLPMQGITADVRVYFGNIPSLNVLTVVDREGQPKKFPKANFLEVVAFFFEGGEEGTLFQKLASGTWSMAMDIERRENKAAETKKTTGAWEMLRAISRGALLTRETYPERVNRMFAAYVITLHYKLQQAYY